MAAQEVTVTITPDTARSREKRAYLRTIALGFFVDHEEYKDLNIQLVDHALSDSQKNDDEKISVFTECVTTTDDDGFSQPIDRCRIFVGAWVYLENRPDLQLLLWESCADTVYDYIDEDTNQPARIHMLEEIQEHLSELEGPDGYYFLERQEVKKRIAENAK